MRHTAIADVFRRVFLSFLLVCSANVLAARAASLSKDWKRLDSEHFIGVGNASERDLRRALSELEGFRSALAMLFPRIRLTSDVPTQLVLFKNTSTFARFAPRNEKGKRLEDIAGYFLTLPSANFFVLSVRDDEMSLEVAYHEFAHYVLHRNVHGLPAWLNEGLSDFYSTFETNRKDGRFTIGRAPRWRVQTLRSEPLLPLRQIMTPEGSARLFARRDHIAMFYAESWAFVHFITFSDHGRRRGQLSAYITALTSGHSSEEAFQTAFGGTFDELELQLRRYIALPAIPAIVIDPQGAAQAVAQIDKPAEPLTVAAAESIQGNLLVSMGALEDADRRLAAALADDSGYVPARVWQGELRLQQERYDDALGLLQSAATEARSDLAAQYFLGLALRQVGRYEEALQADSRATTLNPQSPTAWYELSLAALALSRDSQAEAAFTQVRRIDSDESWLRSRAYAALPLGRPDIAARDALEYIHERGWGDDGATYTAFLAAIAYRRLGRFADADATLTQAAALVDPKSWSANVLGFLQGKFDSAQFLARADDTGERTEAHTYIGFRELEAGRTKEALEHFQWVKDGGSRNYMEYPLALGELRRLKAP
jgi:tetratricopeptide (TPR) repeat protein